MTYANPETGIRLIRLGLIDYKQAWDIQEQILSSLAGIKLENRNRAVPLPVPNYMLICEHPPVFTLGKSGSADHLLVDEHQLEEMGAGFYRINRGGDITHHGPGQLVVYPIFDLENFFTDIHRYLRYLEEAVIKTLEIFGIKSGRYPGYTGVWMDPETPGARKICAMGVRCSRWVTMHGLALNVNNRLDFFQHIIPCGISEHAVTSMAHELGEKAPTPDQVAELLAGQIAALFCAELIRDSSLPQGVSAKYNG
jgi:lipoyl(octanoyl) transferase